MRPFTVLAGPATVLPQKNIDAEIIFPARFLTTPTRAGLGAAAFQTYRFGPDGELLKESPFNRADGRVAPIIIAGENFGGGPSCEHAAWALDDFGVRAIVSPRFAEMFCADAFRNGLLLIELPQNAIDSLVAAGVEDITINLASQTVSTPGWGSIVFDIEPSRKAALLGRLDNIGAAEPPGAKIAIFEQEQGQRAPWINPKIKG